MVKEMIELSRRIEKGFAYMSTASEQDKNKYANMLVNLMDEYEKKLQFVTDEDTKEMLTRIFVLSVRG